MQVLKDAGTKDELELRRYINNTEHVVVKNYLENRNYIFITFWAGSNASHLIIKKDTWKKIYFKIALNDVDGGVWENPVYLSEDDELYIPVSAARINGHKVVNKTKKGFIRFRDNMKSTGIPVIMRCKLK